MCKFNNKLLIVLFLLVLLSIFYVNYKDYVHQNVRDFLEWKNLNLSLWIFISICFIVHYLSIDKFEKNKTVYINNFPIHYGVFSNAIFSVITFGLATTTSVSIIKGIYIQKVFEDKIYFFNFDNIDIGSILVICSFLLLYSMSNSIKVRYAAIKINTYESASSPE